MTSSITWQALGVEVNLAKETADYQVVYAQHGNGLVIGWCGWEMDLQLSKILAGLELVVIDFEAAVEVSGWVLVGDLACAKFWPQILSQDEIYQVTNSFVIAAPAVEVSMADKKIKLLFWQKILPLL